MSYEADFDVQPLRDLKIEDKYTNPMTLGAVASLLDGRLDRLDTVQGDQLCHMRSVIVVICAILFRSYLKKNGDVVGERHSLSTKNKDGDEAFVEEYAGIVKTCFKVLGDRRMEILTLCFDTTRDVTWVFTPMGISTYFRDQGRVDNKAEKQSRLQELCIVEFTAYVDAMCKHEQAGSFLDQLKQALQLMRKNITDGGKNIPVLDFFIASILVYVMNFTQTEHSAVATRRIPISPPAKGSLSENGTVALEEIVVQFFEHDMAGGQHSLINVDDMDEEDMDTPLLFTQAWNKYNPGDNGAGVNSPNHEAYSQALAKRINEMLVRYVAKHPSYAESVGHDIAETEAALKQICGRGPSQTQETDVTEFSFNPFGENASLIDIWYQAVIPIPGLGAGVHKPLDAIQRGKIYVETTEPTAWNIDHVFGATPRQILQWRHHLLKVHKDAGNPDCGYYEVVAGSTTLPCDTEEDARRVADTKDKKRKKDFIKAHPKLEPITGHTSWEAALA
ncbi:hypothetical protein C8J57DRAFT_1226321 [Mycena rebaudengoi]|nr:hypothetical protein C8J57DRAFT_1226321 [Mycena rebaudengoi]